MDGSAWSISSDTYVAECGLSYTVQQPQARLAGWQAGMFPTLRPTYTLRRLFKGSLKEGFEQYPDPSSSSIEQPIDIDDHMEPHTLLQFGLHTYLGFGASSSRGGFRRASSTFYSCKASWWS